MEYISLSRLVTILNGLPYLPHLISPDAKVITESEYLELRGEHKTAWINLITGEVMSQPTKE